MHTCGTTCSNAQSLCANAMQKRLLRIMFPSSVVMWHDYAFYRVSSHCGYCAAASVAAVWTSVYSHPYNVSAAAVVAFALIVVVVDDDMIADIFQLLHIPHLTVFSIITRLIRMLVHMYVCVYVFQCICVDYHVHNCVDLVLVYLRQSKSQ